jgi:hypothetical protein
MLVSLAILSQSALPGHPAVDLWTIGKEPIAHKLHSLDGDGYMGYFSDSE